MSVSSPALHSPQQYEHYERPHLPVTRFEDDDTEEKPAKRTRISAACSFCRSRKSRCDGKTPCGHCIASGQAHCIYPPKSRKVDAEYVAELEAKARYLEELQTRLNMPSPTAIASSAPPPPPSQFASGPLPLPTNTSMHRYQSTHPYTMGSPFAPSSSSPVVSSGLGALADAAIAEHEQIPPHFANKQSPGLLPLSIADLPPDPGPSFSSRPVTRDGPSSGREGVALIAQEYPGGSSTSALAGSVQNAVHHLIGSQSEAPRPDSSSGSPNKSASYRPQDNRFIFQHSAAPEDLYILPHRPLADQLLQIFHDHIFTVVPIFHWPSFEAKYLAVWGADAIDTDLLGILNLIFANAALIAPEGVLPAGKAYESSMRFYKRALKIMYPLVLASESIAGLQCMILMTHYLQFSPEAQLCWTTCGNCVRVAQCRGFHVPSTTEHLDPVERETRRRIWGACVQLDSIICVTLGFPSSLSASECLSVEPLLVDDRYLTHTGAAQPANTPSALACFAETNKLSALQVEAVNQLYTTKDASTSTMPDVQAVLALDRNLADWQTSLPVYLTLSQAGVQARRGRRDLETQAIILTSRALALKMLIHRPLLFYLCSRGQVEEASPSPSKPSPLDERIARSSAELCAEAAVGLVAQCLEGWRQTDVRCWAMQLYYVHSAALVMLAARIVDENDERRGQTKHKIVDVAETDASLTRVLDFLGELAGEISSSSVPAAVSSGPARKTARRCRAMLLKISEGLNIATLGRKSALSPAASSGPSNLGADDRYEDYARAFLELVPNGSATNGYDNGLHSSNEETLMGQWSMHDLLTANSLPTHSGFADGMQPPRFEPVHMFETRGMSQMSWTDSPEFSYGTPLPGV